MGHLQGRDAAQFDRPETIRLIMMDLMVWQFHEGDLAIPQSRDLQTIAPTSFSPDSLLVVIAAAAVVEYARVLLQKVADVLCRYSPELGLRCQYSPEVQIDSD